MRRVLYIAHRLPYPPDKGERVRAFNEIKALSEHFRITIAALVTDHQSPEHADGLRACCEKVIVAPLGHVRGIVRGGLSLLAGRSVTEGYFRSRLLGRLIAQESSREPFDLVMGYSSSMLPYVLDVPARAHVIDLVDVDSAKWTSYAERSRWPKKWVFRREAAGVRRLEKQAVERCDAALLVSDAEAKAMDCGGRNVLAVANGVDVEYFRPGVVDAADLGPAGLVFTGTMDYRPNIEGVCWFVREIWPRLKADVPELTFTIVGRNPAPAVCRLAQTPGVTVTGGVPDVRPYLQGAALVVCPLQIARGIQNKVLEAMAMGKPVIGSPDALGGIELQLDVEAIEADSPHAWREQISRLLADRATRDSMGHAARLCVEAKYTWPARMSPLASLCQRLSAGEGG